MVMNGGTNPNVGSGIFVAKVNSIFISYLSSIVVGTTVHSTLTGSVFIITCSVVPSETGITSVSASTLFFPLACMVYVYSPLGLSSNVNMPFISVFP